MWLSGPCARHAVQVRDLLSVISPAHQDEPTCRELRQLLEQIAWQLAQRGVTPDELCRVCREGLSAFEELVRLWHAQRLNDFGKYALNHDEL